MNHDDADKKLPAYHDGELAPDEAERVEHHLSSCSDCRDNLADLQRLAAIVAPLVSIEDTEQFVQCVMARLPEPTLSFLGLCFDVVEGAGAGDVGVVFGFDGHTANRIVTIHEFVAVWGKCQHRRVALVQRRHGAFG